MTVTVELEEQQAEALQALSAKQRRPLEAVVKEVLGLHIAKRESDRQGRGWRGDPVLAAGFGAWEGLVHEDGLAYQRRLRSEWPDPWE